VFSNLCSCCHPNSLFACDVINDFLQSLESSWLANAAAVKSDGHHLRGSFFAFFVQSVEGAFDVVVEVCRRPESGGHVEFVVIAIYKI
jgi:hypothetical protein